MADPRLRLIRERFTLQGEEVLRDGKPITFTRPAKRYRQVGVGTAEGRKLTIYFHQLKFFLAHGYLPPEVDHRDRDLQNNLLDNLRPATPAQNKWNQEKRERPFPPGVFVRLGRYRARLKQGGKQYYLGTFDTPEEAGLAVRRKSKELRGEFHRD